ncbi:MAG TPA: DNA polymerase III subunit gamma/tau [Patescibacteria group bacterium]|jgi:DNA polymerase-3 subunit gamma/tau|nr:DNA polymerase III subunit gamma/tau [Patescibacteria group bacterium]
MAVLYQKYRPQTFAEVVGQEPIVQTLRNAANAGELAHAYLFTGSRGVGKTTIARLLAKAANCTKLKDGSPCGKCDVCLSIAAGTNLDVIEIDAASHTGVDNVRELIEHAGFRPTSLAMKVFIIDEVHMLSKAAFNALLKTLEEPPAHAMFILATTDIEKVPDTIASRTQRFDFKRITPGAMATTLSNIAKDQKLKLADGVVEAVIAQSEGSMRDALSRLDMIASLGTNVALEDAQRLLGVTPLESVQDLINKIIVHDSASLPDFFDSTFSSGADPAVFNRSTLQYLRLLLHAKLTGNSDASLASMQTAEQKENFTAQVTNLQLPQLMLIIRLFLRSYKELSNAALPELPLLLAAIEASMFGVAAGAATTMAPASAPAVATAPAPAAKPGNPPQVITQDSGTEKPTTSMRQMEAQRVISAEEADDTPTDASVTLTELTVWWPDVVSRVKTENSPIATLLKNSPITEVKDGKITIAVKYLFHKEHIDNKKHAAMIMEAIEAVSGKRMAIRAVINNEVKEPALAQTVDALSDALKVFGGELVE